MSHQRNHVSDTFVKVFLGIVLILLLFGLYSTFQINKKLSAGTQSTLPEIDLYRVVPANCNECFSLTPVEQFVQQTASAKIVNTKTLKADTTEAQELIRTYKLKRLPALVIKGEVTRITLQNFDKRDDALVFDVTPPPYFDVLTARVEGKITATIIKDSRCKECFDPSSVVQQLQKAGVSITLRTVNDYSNEGADLIKKYHLTKVPALIFSKDALAYELISRVWDQVGTKESDGSLVLRNVNPPFKDILTNTVKGIVDITYLTDSSCKQCYNVSFHKQLLVGNFAMQFGNERFVDMADREGNKLVSAYKITKVPTVIISQEAEVYPSFTDVWKNVGIVSADGSFVFTNLDLLEGMTYKDLKNKTTVTVAQH